MTEERKTFEANLPEHSDQAAHYKRSGEYANHSVQNDWAVWQAAWQSSRKQALKEATQVTCQIYGHVVGACVECNTHSEVAQQVPMADDEICTAYAAATGQTLRAKDENLAFKFVSAIEAHHGIRNENNQKGCDDE